ncbi:hypothetical protein Goarm_000770, partial [Gossypium armourianum]|nr:hypothetical protein [Gossypium armourianum]
KFWIKPNSPNLEIHYHCEDNWVYLFSDGVVARASENAFAGGVVRDQVGNWILGFNHYLGRCSLLEAELWGILDGILILLSKGYKKVRILKESVDSDITLLRRVKRFLRSEGQWEIKYVPRECNLIVDQLAKISLSWQTSLQIFEVPPNLVVMAIQ